MGMWKISSKWGKIEVAWHAFEFQRKLKSCHHQWGQFYEVDNILPTWFCPYLT